MTSSVRCKLSVQCDRTGRCKEYSLSFYEAQQLAVAQRERAANAKKIHDFLLSLEGALPDLVVVCDDKIVLLNTVIDKTGKSILRLLHTLTRSPLFPEPTRRARDKKQTQTR